jgi:hypothetical protein
MLKPPVYKLRFFKQGALDVKTDSLISNSVQITSAIGMRG